MEEKELKELQYLSDLIGEIKYKEFPSLQVAEGKYIKGIISPKKHRDNSSKLFEMQTVFDTIVDIDMKIKYSFQNSMEFAYSKEIIDNFNPMIEVTIPERTAYYFIENAIFRVSTLWDLLAQLYNLQYDVGMKPKEIQYNKFFKGHPCIKGRRKKTILHNLSKIEKELLPIKNYLKQDDNINLEDLWEGNHKYLNEIRNQMTHRNGLSVVSYSNFDLNLKSHPQFMLKRIIEDYYIVSKFILSILDTALNDLNKDDAL